MEQKTSTSPNRNSSTDSPKLVGQLLDELQVPENVIKGESFLAKQHQDRKQKAQQKREAAVELAENALLQLENDLKQGKSETLVKFLQTMSTFHSYSFNNQLLIAIQNPEATRVAGFHAWKKLGRFVKKGETGIRILAPMIGKAKKESTDEELVDGKATKRVYGFRVVSVFDVSQTDGKALPGIGEVKGDPGELLPRLRKLIQSKGIQVTYDNLNGPEGISEGGAITIDKSRTSANEFSVLVHEFAHELLHRGPRRKHTTKTQRETEAEAVAFVVCHAFDIDTRDRSNNYIQLYQGDSKLLAETLDQIRETAAQIIMGLKTKPACMN